MDSTLKFFFDEFNRKLDEIEARWERRFPLPLQRAAEEHSVGDDLKQIAAAQQVIADNWGGFFDEGDHSDEQLPPVPIPMPDATSSVSACDSASINSVGIETACAFPAAAVEERSFDLTPVVIFTGSAPDGQIRGEGVVEGSPNADDSSVNLADPSGLLHADADYSSAFAFPAPGSGSGYIVAELQTVLDDTHASHISFSSDVGEWVHKSDVYPLHPTLGFLPDLRGNDVANKFASVPKLAIPYRIHNPCGRNGGATDPIDPGPRRASQASFRNGSFCVELDDGDPDLEGCFVGSLSICAGMPPAAAVAGVRIPIRAVAEARVYFSLLSDGIDEIPSLDFFTGDASSATFFLFGFAKHSAACVVLVQAPANTALANPRASPARCSTQGRSHDASVHSFCIEVTIAVRLDCSCSTCTVKLSGTAHAKAQRHHVHQYTATARQQESDFRAWDVEAERVTQLDRAAFAELVAATDAMAERIIVEFVGAQDFAGAVSTVSEHKCGMACHGKHRGRVQELLNANISARARLLAVAGLNSNFDYRNITLSTGTSAVLHAETTLPSRCSTPVGNHVACSRRPQAGEVTFVHMCTAPAGVILLHIRLIFVDTEAPTTAVSEMTAAAAALRLLHTLLMLITASGGGALLLGTFGLEWLALNSF